MYWANSGAEPVLPFPAKSAIAPAPLLCNKAPTVHLCRESHVTFGLQAVRITARTDKKERNSLAYGLSWYLICFSKPSEILRKIPIIFKRQHIYAYTTYYVLGYTPTLLRCGWRNFIKTISQSLPFISMYGLHMRPFLAHVTYEKF